MTTAEDLGIEGIDEIGALDIEGSAIYRARQLAHNRLVAVKILDGHQEPLVPKRFDLRRKQLQRFAEDPDVVSIYATGLTAAGEQYLIMPYFRIGSLGDQLDHGPMPWHRAAELVMRTAEIIGRAHDLGLVLGDVKPSSIMLADASSPLLALYGMATRRFDDGTPSYRAPEAVRRSSATAASDVYSLALTLAALIAGRAPNRGPLSREFMAEVGALAPERITEVIEQGVAGEPSERYRSAGLFADDLRRAIGGDDPDGSADEPFDLDELLRFPPPPLLTPGAPPPPYGQPVATGGGPDGNGNGMQPESFDETDVIDLREPVAEEPSVAEARTALPPPTEELVRAAVPDLARGEAPAAQPTYLAPTDDQPRRPVLLDDVGPRAEAASDGFAAPITSEGDGPGGPVDEPPRRAEGFPPLLAEPITAEVPIRTFDRQHPSVSHPPGFLRLLDPLQSVWLQMRRSLGALLALLGFAVIAVIVGVLVVRDLRSTGTNTAPNSTFSTVQDEGSPSTFLPTSVAPVLIEPPATHETTTTRQATTATPSSTATTAAPTTATTAASTSRPATTRPATTRLSTTKPATTKPPTTVTTQPPATTARPPTTENDDNEPLGPPVPLVQAPTVSRIRATTARVQFTSPSCVTASFRYAPEGGRERTVSGGQRCSESFTLLLGTVTPRLSPATDYTVRITATATDGARSSQTLSFTTLG